MYFLNKAINGRYIMVRNGKLNRNSASEKPVVPDEFKKEDTLKGSGMSDLKEKLLNLNLRTGRLGKSRSISFSN